MWRSILSSGKPGGLPVPGPYSIGLAAVEADQVGLEPLEALAPDLFAECHDVVERAHRIDAAPLLDMIGIAGAIGAAMRPVELQSVAYRAAQHFIDRHAQRLGLDVDERVLDRRNRHLVDAASRLPAGRVEIGAVALDRPRVLADEPLRHFADDLGQPLRAVAFHVFGPTDDAVVGGDLQKRIDPPAGIAMQVFDFGNLHRRFLRLRLASIVFPRTIMRRSRRRCQRGGADAPFGRNHGRPRGRASSASGGLTHCPLPKLVLDQIALRPATLHYKKHCLSE